MNHTPQTSPFDQMKAAALSLRNTLFHQLVPQWTTEVIWARTRLENAATKEVTNIESYSEPTSTTVSENRNRSCEVEHLFSMPLSKENALDITLCSPSWNMASFVIHLISSNSENKQQQEQQQQPYHYYQEMEDCDKFFVNTSPESTSPSQENEDRNHSPLSREESSSQTSLSPQSSHPEVKTTNSASLSQNPSSNLFTSSYSSSNLLHISEQEVYRFIESTCHNDAIGAVSNSTTNMASKIHVLQRMYNLLESCVHGIETILDQFQRQAFPSNGPSEPISKQERHAHNLLRMMLIDFAETFSKFIRTLHEVQRAAQHMQMFYNPYQSSQHFPNFL